MKDCLHKEKLGSPPPSANERVWQMSRIVNDLRKAEVMTAVVQEEYDYVVYLDAGQNSYVMYAANNEEGMAIPSQAGDDYEAEMMQFNRRHVPEEEQEDLIEKMKLANILAELARHREYIIYCTGIEKGIRRDKKLRFSFLQGEKNIILITRTDITEIRDQQRRNHKLEMDLQAAVLKNQEKTLHYFEDMPVAFCVIRVDLDAKGEPCDFVFTYLNDAHAELEGTTKEQLLHKSFYRFFPNADKKWLKIYYKTAYQGMRQQFTDYSPEIDRYLEISTYQTEYGCCGCILKDVTNSFMLEIEVEKNRERETLLLRNTTDAIFQYDMEDRVIYSQPELVERYNMMPKITDIPYGLVKNGLLMEEFATTVNEAIAELQKGAKTSSCEVMARLNTEGKFSWYNIFFSAYVESHTGKRRVIGFLKNINATVLQRKWLEKAASLDSLTGLMNLATAKGLIEHSLFVQAAASSWEKNAFFMFDLDNFKEVNDRHGHAFGDVVLQQFAETLKAVFSSDQIVFRHGGDEFAAFATRIESREVAEQICQKIFTELGQLANTGILISVSIGVFVSSSLHNYDEYYKRADALLYQVKRQGKRSYLVKDDDR